ncbi:cation:proton antiporter [Pedobacter punctiformis]|uniref:Cation:proton antiporter n=1 Tax=Pedobacter punctiformis TaxID=3004097 RepID=A0ABT4L3J5_9SPHI|nr:cation:proton antiporter [Pedobacter sp. HCMS5-2]MCZ4242500.1 cation:proton antiporter [Pedobacter sp. HCMS5-2]
MHLPPLISDLGLILASAGITTLIFKKIKQPLVLGYIIAGLLVGPYLDFLPTVTDRKSIDIWGEIGVIFLLFSLGLEFSFKKLVKVGGAASITAIVKVLFVLGTGYLVGKLMDWSDMNSLFLGGILSISSTMITIKAFEELGIKHKKFAGLVFGVLIVEDLVAILLLVLFSTVAVSQQSAGPEMLQSILKLGFFLILWFLGGIFLIPSFLKATKKLMNDETMLVVSLALCLIMVILADKVGFSAALGAFIMGSILAETTQAERIEHLTKSVKDLFSAIFFVSVGMLIDPSMLVKYAGPIIIVTLVIIVGKILSTILGALLSGQPLKTSVQAGMSLAQIGEFSFIIASLGLSLKVTSDFLYPIAVAAAAITTFTTPYLIKLSEPFYNLLIKILPKKWQDGIDRYSSSTEGITKLSDWRILLKSYAFNTIIHSVIIIAVIFLAYRFIQPFMAKHVSSELSSTLISVIISFILMAPFLWALSIRRIQKTAYSHLWLNKKYTRGPLIAIEFFRIALGVFFVGFLMYKFFDTWIAAGIALVLIVLVMIVFSRKLQSFYNKLEKRFILNLNARENQKPDILPWDTHLTEIMVSPESEVVGKTLSELMIREKFGVNIAMIERGKITIPTPGREERLYPNDKLLLIGADDQLAGVKNLLEVDLPEIEAESNFPDKEMTLQKVVINTESPVYGLSIRNAGIREKAQALVVGIERGTDRILNPSSDFIFDNGDVIWIVGNSKKIKEVI